MKLDTEQEVARVLAQGLLRWQRRMHGAGFDAAPQAPGISPDRLELSGETRLSGSDDTRGLSPRDDGDEP